ncbi:hypothetical protein BSKO_00010 [Bryopsis sp. KO-2023]|nr:hypothetical protein BSKO_00010 [Bryopsis sp. KO-2023]
MKHNNVIPNAHFRKQWQLRVRTWFWQPAKKLKRRQARAAKAQKVFPRPIQKLKPLIRCSSQRYNRKLRLGTGFTREELKAAGIPRTLAPRVGIRVDKRRCNKSLESMQRNVARLKAYKSNLIIIPKNSKSSNSKGIYSSEEERKNATQHPNGPIMPYKAEKPEIEFVSVTADMKSFDAIGKVKAEIARKKEANKPPEEEEEPVKGKKKKK